MSKRMPVVGQEVIVRRRSKKPHEESHGGAWKVAFADFTMAMMALFMVLWIVNPRNEMTNPSQGDVLANPLVEGGAGVFDGTSRDPLELEGVPLPQPTAVAAGAAALAPVKRAATGGDGVLDMRDLAALLEQLKREMNAVANLEVDIVPQGLRILLKDDGQRFMFPRGSARLDAHFHALLTGLARILSKVDNKLIISGHTDATPYRSAGGYDNWNLSGDRALQARRALVEAGVVDARVLQVTAHADGVPIRPDAPQDGVNRRVEILLLTERAEQLYQQLFASDARRARLTAEGARLIEAGQP